VTGDNLVSLLKVPEKVPEKVLLKDPEKVLLKDPGGSF